MLNILTRGSPFEDIYRLLLHDLCVVDISLERGLDILVAKPCLYILHVRAALDQYGGVGVPEGVVVKRQL